MTDETKENINDKIYVTSRIRMISERKALRNQTFSYLAVTYYSVITVILSVFAKYYSNYYPMLEEINIASAVVVLVASLVAAGFRFETRANTFRECYLKLQRLYNEKISGDVKQEKYDEILWDYPNHSTRDYYDLLVTSTLFEGKKLWIGSNEQKCTSMIFIHYSSRFILFYGSAIIMLAGPVLFLLWPMFQAIPINATKPTI